MNIKNIISDSLRYPFRDWKKFLMFGLMFLIPFLVGFAVSSSEYVWISIIFMFFVGFFVNGYLFRILNTSLDDLTELPEFDDWKEMFIDGVKVFSVVIVYTAPVILIIAYLLITLYQLVITGSTYYQGSLELNQYILSLVNSEIGSMFENYIIILYDILGIYAIVGIFYIIIIIPICLMGLGNMANYYGEFSAAFRLREIFEDINCIGWINLIKWYIVIGIIYLILFRIIPGFISSILYLNHLFVPIIHLIWGGVLIGFIVVPFSYMFFARAVALLYMSE
jgi:hypothetical protein